MPTFAEVRAQYPQYADLSDQQLAEGLHKKFYSDMSFADFSTKIGYQRQRFGSGKSYDAMADGEVVPSESIRYTGAGTVPASSGLGQRIDKYGTPAGFDFSVKPEDVRGVTRAAGVPVRGLWNAASALPGLAADVGVAGRNLVTGSNYELPSAMSQRAVDQALPLPDVPGDKTLEFMTSLVGGAKLPMPQVSNPVPAGFVKPGTDVIRQQTLASARNAGYVVPPSTTNPTRSNQLLESVGGKIATAQDAAARNQSVTNTLAKRALGLSEDAPLTEGALTALRKEAGESFEALRKVGEVPLTDDITKKLDAISAKFVGSKLKDALGGGGDVPKIIQAIKDEPLTGDNAVDAIALLRDKADEAYRAGKSELGKGYKAVSKTLEDLMETKLSGQALTDFRNARQLIAKSHSVEGAFNASTGNVSAQKLATQLAKKKPLTGELREAARFGQAFPKAAAEINDSGSVRNTDVAAGAITSALAKEPWWLGYPFLRQAMRGYLLGPGQARAVPASFNGIPPEVAMGGLLAEENLRVR